MPNKMKEDDIKVYTQMQNFSQPQQPIVQYRGMQKPYQPAGFVPSYYDQRQQQMQQSYPTRPIQQPQYSGGMVQQYPVQQYPSPQAYHTANYRGDQLGHDQYLRADSMQPTPYSMVQQPQQMNQMNASQLGQPMYPVQPIQPQSQMGQPIQQAQIPQQQMSPKAPFVSGLIQQQSQTPQYQVPTGRPNYIS
jgi:hypothetical protein